MSKFFETSMPGTLLFHSLLGKTLGYSDLAVRIADSLILFSSMLLTFLILRTCSRMQASFAALLLGLLYLSYGPKMALQRDFIGATAILCSIWLSLIRNGEAITPRQAFLSGLMLGIGASFKPQLAIILPVQSWYLAKHSRTWKKWQANFLILVIGAVVSFSVPMLWLWHKGGLADFSNIFFNYLPLHTQIGHDFTVIPWPEKIWYSLSSLLVLNDHLPLTLLAFIGIFISFKASRPDQIPESKLLLATFLLYFFYPAISGQFWYYHWSPFLIFASIAASFVLMPIEHDIKSKNILSFAVLILIIPLTVSISPEFNLQIHGKSLPAPLDGVPDQICQFLEKNLKAAETVQPLDWVNGSIHGLLEANVPVATRFLYDYHFFHHVSRQFIKDLRLEFLGAIRKNPPDYFIFVFVKSRVSGPDTADDFPELGRFIFANYKLVHKTQQFGIFKIKNTELE